MAGGQWVSKGNSLGSATGAGDVILMYVKVPGCKAMRHRWECVSVPWRVPRKLLLCAHNGRRDGKV